MALPILQRLNGWVKVLVTVGPLAFGTIFGYGKLTARVDAQEIQRREDKDAELRELNQIHEQLNRIEQNQVNAHNW